MKVQPLQVRTAAAEHLSKAITALQRDHSMTFDEAATAMQVAMLGAHEDENFPGGGYIVVE